MEQQDLVLFTQELPGHSKCMPIERFFIWDADILAVAPKFARGDHWIRESFFYPIYNDARQRWLNTPEDILEVFHFGDVQLTVEEAKYFTLTGDLEFLRQSGRYNDFMICWKPDIPNTADVLRKKNMELLINCGYHVDTAAVPAVVPGELRRPETRIYLKTIEEFMDHFYPGVTWATPESFDQLLDIPVIK